MDPYPNPWAGMELPTATARDQVWTEAQVRAVIAEAIDSGRPSVGLAVLLAHWFGHRQGDVLGLTWTALDARIRLTSKTGRKVPVVADAYPKLAAALTDERERQKEMRKTLYGPPLDHVIIGEPTGLPWNRWTFGHTFREIAEEAGIPADLQFRDLRATAQTELADAGASILEMGTHSAHTTVQMARCYARPTAAQFRSAAGKRLAGRGVKDGDGTGDGTAKATELEAE